MRRLWWSLLVAVVATGLLAGCFASDGEPWAEQLPDRITIATGGTTGVYHAYGTSLAELLRDRYGVDAEVVTTAGSLENLELVADGEAQVAFSAADAVGDAVAGTGDFVEPADLRALARLYDDFGHLVVRADSDVHEIADLRGRRVSLGAEDSGTALIAGRVLAAAEIDPRDLEVSQRGITESIHAMRTGRVDAFFWSGGLKTPGLVELAEEMPIRLIALDEVVDEMRDAYGHGYRHGVVPQGTYGVREPVQTLAVPNVLVVSGDLPDDVAYALVALLFAHQSELAADTAAVSYLDPHRAIYTAPAPLHDGAMRYYRDTKT
ncbi:TAXI family TRAP transporter solute-binding subunit [Isoptericola jiangsuensis]|uniref:TAXI family TRAP transporter solute-binding subunit n=1 Tax=Isoptericola jiangsuensis TaxID=548579 RepID=UPI003AB0BD91